MKTLTIYMSVVICAVGAILALPYSLASHYVAVRLPCDAIIYTDNVGTYLSQNCYDNTIITSGNNAKQVIDNTISSIPSKSVIYIAPGTYTISEPITITKEVSIIGAGKDKTFLNPSSNFNDAVIKYQTTTTSIIKLSGFSMNLVSGVSGISLQDIRQSEVSDIRIEGGKTGIIINIATSTRFENIDIFNPSQYGIHYKGDNGGENYFTNIFIQRAVAGTTEAGIFYERSTITDTGGSYFTQVLIGGLGKGMNYGYKMVSTASQTTHSYLWFVNSVADATEICSYYFQNVGSIKVVNSWGATMEPGSAGLCLNKVDHLEWNGGAIIGNASAVKFYDAMNRWITIHDVWLETSPSGYWLDMPSSASYLSDLQVTNIQSGSSIPGSLTDNANILTQAASAYNVEVGLRLYTSSSQGKPQALSLIDGATGREKHIRVCNDDSLCILDHGFNDPPLLAIKENGDLFLNKGDISILNSGSVTTTSSTITVTLPKSQPDTNYQILLGKTSDDNCYVSSKTTTSFTVRCPTFTSPASFDWMLIR